MAKTVQFQKANQPTIVITLNEYLANFSPNHKADKAISQWCVKKNYMEKRSKIEWDIIIKNFLNETD